MVCPHPEPDAALVDRPPTRGWYWNANHLARAWLPLIGPEGLGLLDYYLALADHRPGSATAGWTAITLDELTHLTGWGRARLVRLHRLLAAAGLLTVRHLPVAGHGPAVQRAIYRVQRQAAPPTAATLAALAELAAHDPSLAARLRRYTAPAAEAEASTAPDMSPAPEQATLPDTRSASAPAPTLAPVLRGNRSVDTDHTVTTTTVQARVQAAQREPGMPDRERGRHDRPPLPGVPLVTDDDLADYDGVEGTATERAQHHALAVWQAANSRPASVLERQRLAQLAELAGATGSGDCQVGWERVAAAIVEAVEAGSVFVAPRRIARILERWQAAETPAPVRAAARQPTPTDPPAGTPAPGAAAARQVGGDGGAGDRGTISAMAAGPGPEAAATATVLAIAPATTWQPPAVIALLPATPAAVLRAALVAAGLQGEPYLRGAYLVGWSVDAAPDTVLEVATLAATPPALRARLAPRLSRGLSQVLGRAVHGRLVAAATLAPPADHAEATALAHGVAD